MVLVCQAKLSLYQDMSSAYGDFPIGEQSDGLGENAVLFLLDPCRKCLFRVILINGYNGLKDNRAGIRAAVHKMYRAPGKLDAVLDGLPLCVQSWKCRQQGWVDVHDGIGVGCHHDIGNYPHEAGQYHQFCSIAPQDIYQGGIIFVAVFEAAVFVYNTWNAAGFSPLQGIRLGIVADDAGDSGIEFTGIYAVYD